MLIYLLRQRRIVWGKIDETKNIYKYESDSTDLLFLHTFFFTEFYFKIYALRGAFLFRLKESRERIIDY